VPQQKTLHDVFLETLKDIYYAERQIPKALPKMAKAANRLNSPQHRDETANHVERLQQIFEMMNKSARG